MCLGMLICMCGGQRSTLAISFFNFYFMYLSICINIGITCVQCPWKPEEGIGDLRVEVTMAVSSYVL